ncbi:MAG: isoprenylcysteine carboxylmethyltransferase family protein [Hyphomonadaceae bacterium]|nr:isoprenylcysteine carboxylmethyltransferase family protein [Hyphomonadaceae bacterium]
MNRKQAILGSVAFFFAAPFIVAGVIPALLTGWRFGGDASATLMTFGALLIFAGLAVLIECFARFALSGGGTPAPIAPTQRLVVDGLYRHTRNPMYLAVVAIVLGQMLFFAQAVLLAYAVGIWLASFMFVVGYEEPALRRRFPNEYGAYFQAVPRWRPRFTPWRAHEQAPS